MSDTNDAAIFWRASERDAFDACVGKRINEVSVNEDDIVIALSGAPAIRLFDEQSCCERRYFVCDDDISGTIGATFVGLTLRAVDGGAEDEWGCMHEIAFLELRTSNGSITFECHNEHNGYYGGCSLRLAVVEYEG